MKITALSVKNYQAIQRADIAPGDRHLLVIGGRNRAGKSSLLSALEVAFGGKRHAGPEPVRHGKKSARIVVDLDDGALVIERVINRDGQHRLEIREHGEKRRSPQKMLDQLVAERFLDPLAFLRASPREQRDLLVQVAKLDLDLGEHAAARARIYEQRRELRRDLKRSQGALENLGRPPDVEEPIDVRATHEELDGLRAELLAAENIKRRADQLISDEQALDQELVVLRAKLQRTTEERDRVRQERAAVEEKRVLEGERARLQKAAEAADERLRQADEHNRRVERARATAERYAALRREVSELETKVEDASERIEELDEQRAEALAAAEMPIPGLDLDEDQVHYNGAPFSQASDAEQLQASLAIAVALSPELRDVWVKDGSLLDEDSLDAVRRFAEERDCRVWLERVGEGDEGAIVIEEGQIREATEAAE